MMVVGLLVVMVVTGLVMVTVLRACSQDCLTLQKESCRVHAHHLQPQYLRRGEDG